jgi:hypothetical protein
MNNIKNAGRTSMQMDSLNRGFLNTEIASIKQDILFFKNDMLKDIRKLEEKLNLKMTNQNLMSSEQYKAFEKKMDSITTQITEINSLLVNNTNLTEKVNTLQIFKSRTEDSIFRVNARINTFQKEYREYIDNVEILINNNLKYPGIIGKNSRFSNFRHFIDYILKYFNDFNDFKDEIRNFNFNEFKKKIISDLNDFRFAINENYSNSILLIQRNVQDFDKRMDDLIKKNEKFLKANESKFEELENKINNYLSEYQAKFTSLEQNINEKYDEQLKEVENIKNLKNEFIEEMEKIKTKFEEIKKNEESKDINNENNFLLKIINNNYISESQKGTEENNNIENDNYKNLQKLLIEQKEESQAVLKSRNFNNQKNEHQKINNIIKLLLLNNNNNNNKINLSIIKNNCNEIMKKIKNIEEKNNIVNNSDDHSKRMNKTLSIEKTDSLEKFTNILKEKNNDIINSNNNFQNIENHLILSNEEILNKKKQSENNEDSNRYLNLAKKEVSKNNYSISNIANTKITKVLLPESLNKKNKNRNPKIHISNSSVSENKKIKLISNDLSCSNAKKYSIQDSNNIKKSIIDFTKINKQKNEKIKSIDSERLNRRINESKMHSNLKSLMVIKIKSKDKILNDLSKKKKRSSSFENEKDENVQIEFRKTFHLNNKVKELILVNSKNLKKNRKIQI